MKKKAAALQDKLARSLDKANTREAKSRRQAPALPASGAADRRCTKISISLFETDRKRLETIRAYIMQHGGRGISTSQVIKLALRTAPLSKELLEVLDQAAAEDGRKW